LLTEKSIPVSQGMAFSAKVKDYSLLTKFRLSSLVVFSAAIGFVIGSKGDFNFVQLCWLILGGFLVTGSSNAFNQVIERDLDKLMDRTKNRPLPAGRMHVGEAMTAGLIMGISGIMILWFFMNPLCGLLSALSLLIYTLIYTPSKRITPFSVFIGAIPGAFPPLLGYVAARNEIGMEALLLYFLQFIWQFPHFWAIAWVMDDDYKKAGFKMLPSPGGRDRNTAFQTMAYTLSLVPLALLLHFFGLFSIPGTVLVAATGIFFAVPSFRLYKNLDISSAKKLMYASFIYLPVVQIVLMIDKLVR
jgi:protoheme IX farnesyltransferase